MLDAQAQVKPERTQTPAVISTIFNGGTQSKAESEGIGLFLPSPFSGDLTQDPREFIRVFLLWKRFQNLDDSSATAAFALLLEGNASIWLQTIEKDKIQNLDELLDLFLKRYTNHEQNWEATAKLWSSKQLKSQTTHQFIAATIVKAESLNLTKETIFAIVLQGLQPQIRSHVIQSDVKNLDELAEHALRFELAGAQNQTDKTEILEALTEFSNKLQDMQSHTIPPSRRDEAPIIELPKEILPLLDKNDRPWQHINCDRTQSSDDPYSGATTAYRDVVQKARPPQSNGPSTCQQNFRNQNRFNSSRPSSKVNSKAFAPKFNRLTENCQTFYPRVPHFKSENLSSRCNRCARRHDANFCPAIGAKCRACGFRNHFARACCHRKNFSNCGHRPNSQILRDKRPQNFHPLRNDKDNVSPSHTTYYTPSKADKLNLTQEKEDKTSGAQLSMNRFGEISVFVYDKHRFALIDSGAVHSAISAKFLNELPSHRKLDTNVSVKLYGANKERLKVLGKVTLPVNLNGLTVTFDFLGY